MAVQAVPGFDLQPSSQQVPVSTNYLSSADLSNGQNKEGYTINTKV